MDERLQDIEQQLDIIKQRNARVEAEKAWEGSRMRIVTICAITYLVATLFLSLIGDKRFLVDALVPVLGFFVSTQSLPVIRSWWIDSLYRNRPR